MKAEQDWEAAKAVAERVLAPFHCDVTRADEGAIRRLRVVIRTRDGKLAGDKMADARQFSDATRWAALMESTRDALRRAGYNLETGESE